jgi:hypothetical protein
MMLNAYALNDNACLTPRGVTLSSAIHEANYIASGNCDFYPSSTSLEVPFLGIKNSFKIISKTSKKFGCPSWSLGCHVVILLPLSATMQNKAMATCYDFLQHSLSSQNLMLYEQTV